MREAAGQVMKGGGYGVMVDYSPRTCRRSYGGLYWAIGLHAGGLIGKLSCRLLADGYSGVGLRATEESLD